MKPKTALFMLLNETLAYKEEVFAAQNEWGQDMVKIIRLFSKTDLEWMKQIDFADVKTWIVSEKAEQIF